MREVADPVIHTPGPLAAATPGSRVGRPERREADLKTKKKK